MIVFYKQLMKVLQFLISDLEVVMEHLFAVEQICAGLAQIAQVYLHRDRKKNTE